MSGLYIFLGGGIGALLRWSLSLASTALKLGPWIGTLVANVIGCILIFSFVKFFQKSSSELDLFFRVGVLGGLTTFSGFALEIVLSFSQGKIAEAISILLLNILLGIVIGFVILR